VFRYPTLGACHGREAGDRRGGHAGDRHLDGESIARLREAIGCTEVRMGLGHPIGFGLHSIVCRAKLPLSALRLWSPLGEASGVPAAIQHAADERF